VDQAHPGRHLLDLAALQRPDEVPCEQLAVAVLLGGQILGAVLAHERNAALGERGQVVGGHVLDRGEDLRFGPDRLAHPLEARPHAFRIHRGR